MGRLKRRFFLWIHDQIDEAVDIERVQPRRRAWEAAGLLRRTPPQPWISFKTGDITWIDSEPK